MDGHRTDVRRPHSGTGLDQLDEEVLEEHLLVGPGEAGVRREQRGDALSGRATAGGRRARDRRWLSARPPRTRRWCRRRAGRCRQLDRRRSRLGSAGSAGTRSGRLSAYRRKAWHPARRRSTGSSSAVAASSTWRSRAPCATKRSYELREPGRTAPDGFPIRGDRFETPPATSRSQAEALLPPPSGPTRGLSQASSTSSWPRLSRGSLHVLRRRAPAGPGSVRCGRAAARCHG